jgi:hypothetical protein
MSHFSHMPRPAWVFPNAGRFAVCRHFRPSLGIGFTQSPAGRVFAVVLPVFVMCVFVVLVT